ncbi:MAG: ATPase, T2SS/T4P/T4SS family, partial [Sandaracinaceae bacterium]|nr:ATPase, T2SS/T4P/T4SS family [Sandaracinaceae bacterium]
TETLPLNVVGPITVGRDPSCHVVLNSPEVSRRHLTIEALPNGLFMVTDSSANGTTIGTQKVRQQSIQVPAGVPMRVGPYLVRLMGGSGVVVGGGGVPAASSHVPGASGISPIPQSMGVGLGGGLHGGMSPPASPSGGYAGQASVGVGLQQAPPLASPYVSHSPMVGANAQSMGGAAAPMPHVGGAPPSAQPSPGVGMGSYPPPGTPTSAFQPPLVHPAAQPQAVGPGVTLQAQSPPPSLAGVGPAQVQGQSVAVSPRVNVPFAPPAQPGAGAPSVAHRTEPPAHGSKPASSDSPYDVSGTAMVPVEMRKRIHRMLLENLDLASLDRNKMDEKVMRPKVRAALRRIVTDLANELPAGTDHAALIDEITDEALGLGPLERLLADDLVSEIMVVDPYTIYVERRGKISKTALRFTDDEAVRAVIERIVTPLGRRIDESTPLVDARLKDGSRVNAVIKPLAIKGSCITIRKFSKTPLTLQDLVRFGSMTEQMAKFLVRSVKARKNIVISGGTGSGKTTLLNVLSAAIPEDERIVTIEDAAELQLKQPHVVSLETRPANMEGKGEYTIRDLVKNALRMRPDRIIVGECRGGEALDMLQAMNTGHEGSMTTTHANSPREAISRLETLALMSGLDLPARAIREQIANAVDLIIQQTRLSDGTRKVTSISEVVGINDDGEVELHEIFAFVRTGTGPKGEVIGEHRATGYLPSFIDELIVKGLVTDGDYL